MKVKITLKNGVPTDKVGKIAKAVAAVLDVKVDNILETIGVITVHITELSTLVDIRKVNGVEKVEVEDE